MPQEMSSSLYVGVAVSHPAHVLDRLYTYRVPSRLASRVRRGCSVFVPFGKRTLEGYVLEISGAPPADLPPGTLREIEEVADGPPLLTGALLRLLPWLRDYYGATAFEALQVLLPAPVRGETPKVRPSIRARLSGDDLARAAASLSKRCPAQAKALSFLDGRELFVDELMRATGATSAVLKALAARGLVETDDVQVRRDPLAGRAIPPAPSHRLSASQEQAVHYVRGLLEARRAAVVLLEGVTGSGKTQVYIESIRRCLALGRGALVLVPEISLTAQSIDRLKGALGEEIAVLHSGLSDGERYDEWWRIRAGQVRVVIGTRSSVFAPLENLGLVIVDEEHEESFKEQSRTPRYGARQVAIKRAGWERAVVVLGSATPSIESFNWAQEGSYSHLLLPERIKGRHLARCRLVDLRAGASRFSGSLGAELREAIDIRLKRGEKVMLLQNRRGFSSLLCRDCGFVPRCPSCAISLTYHRAPGQLDCHYCHHHEPAPDVCPRCAGRGIRYQGTGTERIEEEVRELFPDAPVFRMDADTTRGRRAHERILSGFAARGASLLIGTQMIAKGLDIPEVTLVGVVDADITLNLPDFRAAERTFQLLMQVAGRAGRGTVPGEVIIQTRDPEHPVLVAASLQDFRSFCRDELAQRKELTYPPFTHLINVVASAKSEDAARSACEALGARLNGLAAIELLGPAPCLLSRLRGLFRWHITLKTPRVPEAMPHLLPAAAELRKIKGVRTYIDVDPMNLM